VIGERRAGEFPAIEVGRSGDERRGQSDRRRGAERRRDDEHVSAERRIGFDRRAFRERRSGPNRRLDSQLGLGAPVEVKQLDPSPAAEPSFAARLREMTRLDLPEAEAERHWKAIARNRKILGDRLGRDAGQEVAALDYFLNINPRLTQPALIESSTLVSFERDAMTDALTGLFNRRYFESGLRREIERCRRYGSKSSLLLLDLDNFKAANDHFGHPAGDIALKTVGEIIARRLRAVDIPCRYGGDEFAIVLPSSDRGRSWLAAERIRVDVGCHFLERKIAGATLGLTVSAGLATYGDEGTTVEALLQAADASLYAAKMAGGDRVTPG
jgi:diguanylate cyclase (GGDEF)-like protein